MNNRQRGQRRRHRAYFATLVPLVAAGLIGCESQRKAVEAPPIPVTVAEVQEYSGAEGVNYSASVVPYTQLSVTYKSAGYVTSILQRKGVDGRVRNLQQGDWVRRTQCWRRCGSRIMSTR